MPADKLLRSERRISASFAIPSYRFPETINVHIIVTSSGALLEVNARRRYLNLICSSVIKITQNSLVQTNCNSDSNFKARLCSHVVIPTGVSKLVADFGELEEKMQAENRVLETYSNFCEQKVCFLCENAS